MLFVVERMLARLIPDAMVVGVMKDHDGLEVSVLRLIEWQQSEYLMISWRTVWFLFFLLLCFNSFSIAKHKRECPRHC